MNYNCKRYYRTPLLAMAAVLIMGGAALVPGLSAGDARAKAQTPHEHAEDVHAEDGYPESGEHQPHGTADEHPDNESGEEEGVHMNAAQLKEFGIQTTFAGSGDIHIQS